MSDDPKHLIKPGSKLVIATHNPGKAHEFAILLAPFQIQILSAGELNLPEPEETGTTFIENARIKAIAAAKAANIIALADDSGFCISALNGDPGIYSSRWAGPNKDYQMAMQTMYDKIKDQDDRSAWFSCVLCIAWPNGQTIEFEEKAEGEFIWPARGSHGHGYDPIFQPNGSSLTFAEMTEDEKNKISHRALAFQQLIHHCFKS